MSRKVLTVLIFLFALNLPAKLVYYGFNKQCNLATEIFTGKVISLQVLKSNKFYDETFYTYRICFLADKIWKGNVRDTIVCIAWEFICAPNIFEKGKSYLVYSTKDTITLGNGRSGDLSESYIRADMRKLYARYLFCRPQKSHGFRPVALSDLQFGAFIVCDRPRRLSWRKF